MTVQDLSIALCVRSVDEAVRFYRSAFGGTELFRLVEPGGRGGHAEVAVGRHVLMVAEEFPEHGFRVLAPDQELPVVLHLEVDDADAAMAAAVAAGATLLVAAANQFYGLRSGRVRDPFGYIWAIGQVVEKVAPDEMQRRYTAMFE